MVAPPVVSDGTIGAAATPARAGAALPLRERLAAMATPRLRSTFAAGFGTSVGNAFGMALPFVVTAEFSSGRTTDAYFLVAGGAQFAAGIVAMLGGPVLAFVAKPISDAPDCALALARRLGPYALVLAAPVTVTFVLLVQFVLLPASTFTVQQREEAHTLVAIFTVYPILAAFSAVLTGIGYARGQFARTSSANAFRGGLGIAAAVLCGPRIGIEAVAVGVTVGEATRCLALAYCVRPSRGYDAGTAVAPMPGIGRQFLAVSSPAMTSNVISAINPLVDKAVAARLGVGYVTLIELAEKLFYLPMMLLITTVSTVSGAAWSRIADDVRRLRHDYRKVQRVALRVTSAITLVAVIVMLTVGDHVAEAVHAGNARVFVIVFILYVVGLPAAMAADLGGRLLVSIRRTVAIPVLALLLVALNLGADIAGAAVWGVFGIAVSSTLVRASSAGGFLLLTSRALARRRH